VPSADEVTIRLKSPADLFRTVDTDMFLEHGRLVSGIDEVLQELTPRRLGPGRCLVILLPAEQVRPETSEHLRQAIQRYCRLRLRRTELALQSHRREAIASLGVGGLLFLIGLGLSFYFEQATQPTPLKLLLGDGVFLVIAWVGLWYPLDTFVFVRRPLLREKRVLEAVLSMGVTVRVDNGTPRQA
jgi:hypothetical protein